MLHFIRNKFAAAKAATFAAIVASVVTANTVMAQAATGFDLAGAQADVLGYVATTLGFIVAVGIAVLGLVMVAKAVKWARKAG